ncbi:MAG: hypothetical protein K5773_07195 [Pseudobutyrivibrio sp.]|nr:hypothetical protein [Pseudobutyrivibrio sp.]
MKTMKRFFTRNMIVALFAVILVLLLLSKTGVFGGKDSRTKVACVGDSLTYGSGVLKTRDTDCYPVRLQSRLGTSHEVLNFGLRNACASKTGDLPYVSSEEYKASLESNPDMVLLMLGTNDAKVHNWDPEAYETGLKELVQTYQGLDTKPTVYILRSPYCFAKEGGAIAEYDIRPDVVTNELGPIVDRVAADTGANVIDMYSYTCGEEDMYTDGIHFNKDGYDYLASKIYHEIR